MRVLVADLTAGVVVDGPPDQLVVVDPDDHAAGAGRAQLWHATAPCSGRLPVPAALPGSPNDAGLSTGHPVECEIRAIRNA